MSLAIAAQKELEKEIHVSVVSLPSWDRFEQQSVEYKESILPKHLKARLAIELGASLGWREYIGEHGDKITIDHFGASAPASKLFEEYGFTVGNVVNRFKALLEKMN